MKKIFLIAAVATLAGCVQPMPSMEVLDVSRADGVVTVGYDFSRQTHWMEKGQQMNFSGGDALAWRVCQGWGFAGARAINTMPVSKCADWSIVTGVCYVGQQKQQYQCTATEHPQ